MLQYRKGEAREGATVKAFGRKYWRVLAVVVLATAIVAYMFFSASDKAMDPRGSERSIALYSRDVTSKPSAATARKLVDCVISTDQPALVFAALQETMSDQLGVPGVSEEFIRGFEWYLAKEPDLDNILWLAKAIRGNSAAATLNEELARYYLTLGGEDAVRAGNELFTFWPLSQEARERYLTSLSGLWSNLPLPLSPGSFKGAALIGNPLTLVAVPEFEDVSSYLRLWRWCWQEREIDPQFVEDLRRLSPEQDPLNLFWRLWGVAALRNLQGDWQHPQGIDVAALLPDIFPYLGADEIGYLYSCIAKPEGSAEVFLLLRQLAESNKSLGKNGDWLVAQMLLGLAGQEATELGKSVIYTTAKSVSQELADLYHQLASYYSGKYVQRAEMILGLGEKSDVGLVKARRFIEPDLQFSVSPFAPTALVSSVEGFWRLDLTDFAEKHYPGQRGAFNLKGDSYALLTPGGNEIRIMGLDGRQKQRFALTQSLPAEPGTIFPFLKWLGPQQLGLLYSGPYTNTSDELPLFLTYALGAKTPTKAPPHGNYYASWEYLRGVDLYFSFAETALINGAGKIIGGGAFAEANAECISYEDIRLFHKDSVLFMAVGEDMYTVRPGVRAVYWLAATKDKKTIYARVITEQGWTMLTLTDCGQILAERNLADWDWCQEVAAPFYLGERQAGIGGLRWTLIPTGAAPGDNYLDVGGKRLPIILTRLSESTLVLKADGYFYLIIQPESDELWLLKFSAD